MANNLQEVITYLTEESLPILEVMLTVSSLFDRKAFDDWKNLEVKGTRGANITYRKPTRFRSQQNNLAIDLSTAGFFQENIATLSVSTSQLVVQQITDTELSTYPLEQLKEMFVAERMAELATLVDADAANSLALSGCRFAGQPQDTTTGATSVPTTNFANYQQLVSAAVLFRNVGAALNTPIDCILPSVAVPRIVGSNLQLFTPSTNDEFFKTFELGTLSGSGNTKFYQSDLMPQHISGTASLRGNITVTGVTQTTYVPAGFTTNESIAVSQIALSDLTAGDTISKYDMGDIGAATKLKLLQYTGHKVSSSTVQFIVLDDAVAANDGTATITVYPALIYDANHTNPAENLSRALVTGSSGDKVRIAMSHSCGVMVVRDAPKMAAPKLPGKSPFYSASVMSDQGAFAIRSYYGAVLNQPTTVYVNDILYGFACDFDYSMRLLFPFDLTSLLTS